MRHIDPVLADILVCPKCHGPLDELEHRPALRCGRCRLIFPVVDGIPNMILDAAEDD